MNSYQKLKLQNEKLKKEVLILANPHMYSKEEYNRALILNMIPPVYSDTKLLGLNVAQVYDPKMFLFPIIDEFEANDVKQWINDNLIPSKSPSTQAKETMMEMFERNKHKPKHGIFPQVAAWRQLVTKILTRKKQ
jgi:hypothetical protein